MDYRRLQLNYRYNLPDPVPLEDVLPTSSQWSTEKEEIEYYYGQLRRILESGPTYGCPPKPAEMIPGLYVGTASQAENLDLLEKMGITHILNCAGIPSRRVQRQERYSRQEYEEITPGNEHTVDIAQYFAKAHVFLDRARNAGGRVLVYCPDVDRSGAVVVAYLVKRGTALLTAAKLLKDKRKVGMFNKGFMRQLAHFAKDRDGLQFNKPHFDLPNLTVFRVKHRPATSHLLSFI